jgi:hypothetical protein
MRTSEQLLKDAAHIHLAKARLAQLQYELSSNEFYARDYAARAEELRIQVKTEEEKLVRLMREIVE